ncbi:MAG: RDD family protein [Prevotellaceae bacterium]|jgi:uncharacterized RDD family membrane protein YckC|nr:RDD family protein [Prevotellaceae bacterium]
MEKHEIVENNKASTGLRLANFVIDIMVFYFCFILFGMVLAFLSVLTNLNIDFEAMANMDDMIDRLLTACLLVVYYFLLEKLFKGRTIGKFVTNTKVVTKCGAEPTAHHYFVRSLCRMVPFDGISFFWKNGWHDKWSDTRVVMAKQFDSDMQNLIDIENIGINDD